ncbi:MAG TPA: YciI family protein [Pyrinomonadaceae bacterium]|nr:YciI family protein [Pyrinomonadaceae bacterium]
MPNYMLFLHETPATFADLSPEQIEKVIAEYTAFRDGLKESGKFVGSAKLKDEGGKNLSGNNGSLRVTDGPYTEAKEVIGGFYGITADSYEEAVKTASGCPHLRYGGRVEVREIEFQFQA